MEELLKQWELVTFGLIDEVQGQPASYYVWYDVLYVSMLACNLFWCEQLPGEGNRSNLAKRSIGFEITVVICIDQGKAVPF